MLFTPEGSPANDRSMGDDLKYLREIFPKHSRTFDFTTGRMRKSAPVTADVLMVDYSFCRIIDCLEDIKFDEDPIRDFEKRRAHMYLVIDAFQSGDPGKAQAVTSFLKDVPAETPGYRELLDNTPTVIRVFKSLSQRTQDSTIRHGKEMAEGFSNPEVQNIRTLNDQLRYCYYAACKPGDMINDLFEEMGYFNHLSPTQKTEMWPLGHHFGIALQLTNNYKDTKKDIVDGRPKWPLVDIVQKYGMRSYNDLIDPANKDRAMAALAEQISIILPYYESSIKYIDNLPFEPKGLRIFCGDALAMSAATIRAIQSPDTFYSQDEVKITRDQVTDIDNIVSKLTKREQSPADFIRHLLVSPLDKYKAA